MPITTRLAQPYFTHELKKMFIHPIRMHFIVADIKKIMLQL